MLTFEIEVTEEEIVFSAEGEMQLLEDAAAALEAQDLAGLNRDGQPIVGRSGKVLDLHDTGALFRNVTPAPAQGGLIYNQPYAEEVFDRYKADALNDASMAALEEKLTPMVNEQTTNQEVK